MPMQKSTNPNGQQNGMYGFHHIILHKHLYKQTLCDVYFYVAL
jgi:hypothetical protein